MSNENQFAKLGVIYAIGQVLSKAISFVLLPIYIRELGLGGFGQLALVDAVLDFMASFTIIGIYSGYIRFYREYEESKRRRLKNTALNFALIMSILNIILVLILGEFISKYIFNFDNSYYILILIVFRSIFSQLVALLMCDYSLNFKAGIYVKLNLANLLLNLTFTIIFVVLMKQGISGIYEGFILSNLITFTYLSFVNHREYKFEIDIKMLKNMLKFSGGLIPSCIASTILSLSDRYFLTRYRNFSETGLYSVGYKFGMLIQPLFIDPFKQIFTPYKFSIWKDKDAEKKFNIMFFKYHIIGCFIMLGICIYSKPMIFLLTTKESIVAYKIVPLIVIAYFFYGKSCFYCLGIQIRNKTYLDGLIMLLAGIINLILNIILIPKFGMYGAALATVVSYIAMNYIYIKFSLRLYHVRYKTKNVYKIYIITIILYSIYYTVSIFNIPILLEMVIGMIILIAYLICSVYFNLITIDEVKKIWAILDKLQSVKVWVSNKFKRCP
jgi:O-antigen/teichoic acid export membrane protein